MALLLSIKFPSSESRCLDGFIPLVISNDIHH
jgi:hypothetical protein